MRLNREMESQRSNYERKINGLESQITAQKQTICQLESKILEINTILTRKADVEEQLRTARDHESRMDKAKRELQQQLESAS